jgi:hypothetical protein
MTLTELQIAESRLTRLYNSSLHTKQKEIFIRVKDTNNYVSESVEIPQFSYFQATEIEHHV